MFSIPSMFFQPTLHVHTPRDQQTTKLANCIINIAFFPLRVIADIFAISMAPFISMLCFTIYAPLYLAMHAFVVITSLVLVWSAALSFSALAIAPMQAALATAVIGITLICFVNEAMKTSLNIFPIY